MMPLLFLLALALRWPADKASVFASASASAVALPSASAGSCKQDFSCASCSQVQFCRRGPSGLQEAYRITCGGSTPYCDRQTGACVETAPKGCAEIGIFTCMRDGVFPDPDDCKAYHVCEKGVSNTFKCSTGQYFNGAKCENATLCGPTISCAGKSGTKVAHPSFKSIFAYCVNNKALFLDKCEEGSIMDDQAQQCRPKLPEPRVHTQCFRCSPIDIDIEELPN